MTTRLHDFLMALAFTIAVLGGYLVGLSNVRAHDAHDATGTRWMTTCDRPDCPDGR